MRTLLRLLALCIPSRWNFLCAATNGSPFNFPRWIKTRICPEVFDSASRIACTIRPCSSLPRNSFVRICYQLEPAPPPPKLPPPPLNPLNPPPPPEDQPPPPEDQPLPPIG